MHILFSSTIRSSCARLVVLAFGPTFSPSFASRISLLHGRQKDPHTFFCFESHTHGAAFHELSITFSTLSMRLASSTSFTLSITPFLQLSNAKPPTSAVLSFLLFVIDGPALALQCFFVHGAPLSTVASLLAEPFIASSNVLMCVCVCVNIAVLLLNFQHDII